MYMYAQGRRMTPRAPRGLKRQSVGVQAGESLEQLEKLLDQSVSLWEKTEQRLQGLDVENLQASLARSSQSSRGMAAATTPKSPRKPPIHTSPRVSPKISPRRQGQWNADSRISSDINNLHKDDTMSDLDPEEMTFARTGSSPDLQDDLRDHPSSPGRMTKMLTAQIQSLRKEMAELNETLAKDKVRLRQSEAHIAQLENQLKGFKKSTTTRRYLFDVGHEDDQLHSTVSHHAAEMLGTIAKNEGPKHKRAFFEVRYEMHPANLASGEGHEGDGADDDYQTRMDTIRKFEYHERPSKAFFKGSAEPDGSIPPEKVVEWLKSIEPRNSQDAQPLYILARDLLMRLAEGQVRLQNIAHTNYERKIESLQSRVDAQEELRDADRQKHQEELEKARQQFEVDLQGHRERHSERMEKFVKEVSPLRMKNAVLHNTQQKLKKRIKDMEGMSHMEHMLTWNADQRSQALISLLEDDGIVDGLPDNFLEHCKISEASMEKWSEHFARRLEEQHAGTSTWLQLVCDILNSTPATLGSRVLRWYNVPDLSDEFEMNPKDKGELISDLETRKSTQTILQAMRLEISSGKKDMWDIVSLITLKPRSEVMASLIGFPEGETSLLRDMFPDYLAFLRAKIEDDLAARDTGDVRHALLRLQDSPIYQTLLVSSHIKRNNLFDLDLSRESKAYPVDEASGLIARIYDMRSRQSKEDEESSNGAQAGREPLPFPVYVRLFCVQQTGLRSSAKRMLTMLLASVKAYQKAHARLRVFGRLAGMVSPLKHFGPAEAFVEEWLKLIMMLESGQMVRSHVHGVWADENKPASPGSDRPGTGDSGSGRFSGAFKDISTFSSAASVASKKIMRSDTGKNLMSMKKLHASSRSLTRETATEKLHSLNAFAQMGLGEEHESHAKRLESGGAGGREAEEERQAKEETGKIKAWAASSSMASSMSIKSPSRIIPKEGPGSKAPSSQQFRNWMKVDRSVYMDNAVEAALIVMNELLVNVPGAERLDEEDIRRSLAPARVNVPSGIELPAKDTEKLAFKHLREGGGDDTAEEEEDGACVSLDLASEVILELYLKGIKSVQDAVVVMWKEKEDHWDNGDNSKSPDLDHLRLFLAQECKIMLQERDISQLYTKVATTADTLDGAAVAKEMFTHACRSKRINPSKLKRASSSSPTGRPYPIQTGGSNRSIGRVPATPDMITEAIQRGYTSPSQGVGSPDSNTDDYRETIANLDLRGSDALVSPPRSFRIKPVGGARYLDGDSVREEEGTGSHALPRIPSTGGNDEAYEAGGAGGQGEEEKPHIERVPSTGSVEYPESIEDLITIPDGFIRLESDVKLRDPAKDVAKAAEDLQKMGQSGEGVDSEER